MKAKRRHEGESGPAKLQRGSEDAADEQQHDEDAASSRKAVLKAHIIGLNTQFANWVGTQSGSRADALWTAGVKDYLRYAEGLVEEFSDVIPLGGKLTGTAGSAVEPAPKPAFSFPAPTPSSNAPPATSSGLGGASAGFGFGLSSTSAPPAPAAAAAGGFLFGSAATGGKKEEGPAAQAEGAFGTAPGEHIFGKAVGAGAPATFMFGAAAELKFPSDAAPAPTGGGASSTPAFMFGSTAPACSSDDAAPAAAGAAAAFSFGAAAAPGSSAAPFSFGAATSTAAAAAPASSAPLFSFGAAASTAAAAPAPFSFGAAATGAPSSAPANGGNDAEEEEEGPAKFESAVTVNEESGAIVFKAKSKFSHFAKDAAGAKTGWESKGVGTMMLRTRNDETKKPFVTFTTEAGRVLYIANIPKLMQVMLVEARNAVTFSAPWAPDGTSTPTAQGVMFVFPKGINAVFKAEVEKCQASMAS